MRRQWLVWLVFGVCLSVGLGAMSWISFKVLELDRNTALSRHQAAYQGQLEENARLALWRMDSMLAPIIAQENARPYFLYSAFFPSERAAPTKSIAPKGKDDGVLIPSPLMVQTSDLVVLHFQIAPDGSMTSPQAPTGNMRHLAEAQYASPESINQAGARLEELHGKLERDQLIAALPEVKQQVDWRETNSKTLAVNKDNGAYGNVGRNQGQGNYSNNSTNQQSAANNASELPAQQGVYQQKQPQQLANQADVQQLRGQQEFEQRQNALNTYNDATWIGNHYVADALHATVNEGVMKPLWLADALVLARRVSIHGQEYVQGAWLDWTAVRRDLLEGVKDLLPNADLEMAPVTSEEKEPRMLAALPLRLKVGDFYIPPKVEKSAVRFTLLIAWCSAIIGALAIGLLLRGVISLSERRGAFVSAVTHELRTPLTTLRMYTEMLADGMVKDESKRQQYLNTLRGEANRLGHLVENVLGYSRLERKRSCARLETLVVGELLEGTKPRLAERATQANMTVELSFSETAREARVVVDLVAVEQILFNLVDNACKYAQPSQEPVIRIEASAESHGVMIRVKDSGPGIPRERARRLFRPFSKSVNEAAESKQPGLGLGLALSKRLAKNMGGDLRLEQGNGPGACFVLELV